ncbi:group II intron maturase-specific domain-containing protein [Stieleria sedimenti]|uniref:group II intron maturase-specific domain-containing protein n=1 Tax=Stieleria sedimenti TaxID=2976331 RepID=UPI002B20F4A9|nr:group II intron maturase-specific domain-containing protein [Stieleria sedimenti]
MSPRHRAQTSVEPCGFGGQIRVSPKSLKKFKQRAKEILTRNRGISMRQRFRELRLYLRGWIDYFV